MVSPLSITGPPKEPKKPRPPRWASSCLPQYPTEQTPSLHFLDSVRAQSFEGEPVVECYLERYLWRLRLHLPRSNLLI